MNNENCPIDIMLVFLKSALENKNAEMPEILSEHAKNCKACHRILATPILWNTFISANTSNPASELSNEIQEGQVWKIDFDENTDAVIGLVTNTENTNDWLRLVPIYVAPNEKDIDPETDILIEASAMPNGLPCLIEWWNDRPVEKSLLVKNYGNVSSEILSKIKQRIENPIRPRKMTKSVFIFRQTEKAKGDLLSTSVINKIIDEEKQNAKIYCICFADLFEEQANEELVMAAATKEIYSHLDAFLKNDKAKYYLLKSQNNEMFTIGSYDRKAFSLILKNYNNESKTFKSNEYGKLRISEKEFLDCADIEFIND